MTPDWTSGALEHRMRVELVDPLDMESDRGALSGLVRSGTLSLNYYGDTRAGLDLTTAVPVGESDGWDGTAAMRLIHSVGDWEEELFTGYVTDTTWDDSSGMRTTSYTLSSALYGMQTDLVYAPYTVGENAMGLDVLERIFSLLRDRPHTVLPDALDYRFGSATVYEVGKTWLSVAFDVADRSGDRLDVDGHGYVTVARYVSPSSREPSFSLDTADPWTVALDGVSGSSNALEIPSRAIVHAEKDGSEINARASQPSSSPYTHARRGYNVDVYEEVSDMEPFTQEQAESLASQKLEDNGTLSEKRDVSIMYRPLGTGDVVELTHSGETADYMISTAELDLSAWTWELGLKGV